MSATTASGSAPAVDQPKHPLHALTTFELRIYRRQLESALRFYQKNHPGAPALILLQTTLDEVLAEQEDRARLAANA